MTDLERFIELYSSFGIECKVNQEATTQFIILGEEHHSDHEVTTNDKFDGYGGFHSSVFFDDKGKFLNQGFWE